MNPTQSITSQEDNSRFVRNALYANVIFSGTTGIAALIAATFLANFTGIENQAVFIALGVILIVYAVDLGWVASRHRVDPRFVWAAIILDTLWVAGSIMILLSGWLPLSTAGIWTVALIAEVVAILAVLQFIGLRRLQQ